MIIIFFYRKKIGLSLGVDILTLPYTSKACAAEVATRTADRDSSRYRYSGNRRTRQLALYSEGN